jgi:hypothetical protein
MDVLASRRERIVLEHQLRRALVFRGVTLMANAFVMWCANVRHRKAMRERIRHDNLASLASCWIDWMRLVQRGRTINKRLRTHAAANTRRRLFMRWRGVVEAERTEVCRARKSLDRLRMRRSFRYWAIAKTAAVVRSRWLVVERRALESVVRDLLRTCDAVAKSANRTRCFMSTLEGIVIRFRAARAFRKWPGRKTSIAASELSRRLSRKKHMREKQKIGMHLKGFIRQVQSEEETEDNRMLKLLLVESDGDDTACATAGTEAGRNKVLVEGKEGAENRPRPPGASLKGEGTSAGRSSSSSSKHPAVNSCLPPPTPPSVHGNTAGGVSSSSGVVVKGTALLRSAQGPSFYRNVQQSSFSHQKIDKDWAQRRRTGTKAGRKSSIDSVSFAMSKDSVAVDRPSFVLGSGGSHRAPPLPRTRRKGYQERAVEFGYSDGFVRAKQLVMAFLVTVLHAWKGIALHRRDVRRRELFLKACTKLRRLSGVFYHWLARAPVLSHRDTVWSDGTDTAVPQLGDAMGCVRYQVRASHRVSRVTCT